MREIKIKTDCKKCLHDDLCNEDTTIDYCSSYEEKMTQITKHFTYEELQCPLTKKVKLALGFAEKLEKLRVDFGYYMTVNSCCRSFEYNNSEKIKGHRRSLHIYDFPHHKTGGSCAIDISTANTSKEMRERLIFIASIQGWSIGLGENFLHLDRRIDYTNLPQTVFTY